MATAAGAASGATASLGVSLFAVSQLISIHTDLDERGPADRSRAALPVWMTCVASGGRPGRAHYLAVLTSNDHLVLRFSAKNQPAHVRLVPWFKEQQKRIVAMHFSPDCTWLLCVTASALTFLVPVRAFLLTDQGTSSFGSRLSCDDCNRGRVRRVV